MVHNVSTCYLSSTTLRTLPELIGLIPAKLEKLNLYLPNNVSAINGYETRKLKGLVPADPVRINYITSQLTTRKQAFDVDSLFHVHEISQQQEQRTRWLVFPNTSICISFSLEYFVLPGTPTAITCDVIHFHKLRTQNHSLKTSLLPLNALNEIGTNKARSTPNKTSSLQLIRFIRQADPLRNPLS
jgi:hypothetical protein